MLFQGDVGALLNCSLKVEDPTHCWITDTNLYFSPTVFSENPMWPNHGAMYEILRSQMGLSSSWKLVQFTRCRKMILSISCLSNTFNLPRLNDLPPFIFYSKVYWKLMCQSLWAILPLMTDHIGSHWPEINTNVLFQHKNPGDINQSFDLLAVFTLFQCIQTAGNFFT